MGAPKPYRTIPLADLTGGINDTAAETALRPGQGLRVENWDLDKGGLSSARGSLKWNNQIAPRSAVLCRPDPALSPLYFKAGYSVPLRGYCWAAYNPDYDFGGDFAYEGSFDLGTETFHNRRGRSFQFDVTFRLPEETRLYAAETRGANAPAVGAESAGFDPPHGFDEALDDCTIILQKGGDQTTPMSWALGIVNLGLGESVTNISAVRASNYALVFMWLDAPQFGESSPSVMRYTLTKGVDPSTGDYSTQAFRAVVIKKYIEPGRTYTASVQLGLDTGTAGSTGVNTDWNHDGHFKVYVVDGAETITSSVFTDSSGGGTTTDMDVVRGPTDSLSYLTKYGIRFSGRDRLFFGLGMRSFPWMAPGFIPYGSDCTSIGYGGFQMLDRSAATVAGLYGGGVHTLTIAHVSGDAYVKANHQGLSLSNTNGGISPYAIGGPGGYSNWTGLTNGGTLFNSDALRGYRLIATNDFTAGAMKGGILNILSYSEGSGEYRLGITNGAMAANFGDWAATPMLIQCFRWNQRPIEMAEVRIWSTPRDYEDANAAIKARRRWDLGRGIDITDRTNYDIETLRAYWPMDDSGGTTISEKVAGGLRAAFMAPGGLGTTSGGTRGSQMLAMSGEGEAPCIDFSDNPVVMRALKDMLAGTSQGFALELSCVFPQAYYAIQDNTITLPDRDTGGSTVTGSRPLFVPEIMSWDVKDPVATGQASTPKPIITLTHRGALATTNGVPFKFPMGFSVEVAHRADNENIEPIVPQDLQPFYVDGGSANHNRYSYDASWVGKNVTIQVGIQSTGTADQYDVYIAMSPKDAFLPASGDPGDAEFAYWTVGGGSYSSANYFTAAHLTIKRKDIERSVITLGRWNCGSLGYSELQPCMLVDEVRVYAASAPGSLPATNGGILTSRNGKLEGLGAMPNRELLADDILRHVTPSGTSVDVTDGSATVTPHGNARFFTGEARTSIDSIKETYLYVPSESQRVLTQGALTFDQERFYRISSVAADGSSLTLSQPFPGANRSNAYGASLRLLAYTAFGDDIRDKPLSLGAGSAYVPGVTTVSDVILTDDFFDNVAPMTTNWRLRVYSPFGRTPLSGVLPQWVRGFVGPRRNPIRGIYAHQGKVYAGVRGSLFEADDRWRFDGPSSTLTASLAFRARVIDPGITVPLARDRVEFSQPFTYTAANDTSVTYFDAWVKLRAVGEYQTILWVGNTASDPSAFAGTGGHRVHASLRMNRGRPELVFGTIAHYTGTTPPEKGLFIATGSTPIPAGKWTHIRFAVPTRSTSERVVMKPQLKVNGRKSSVVVNAVDNSAAITGAYDWFALSLIVNPTGGKTIMGVGHDAYRAPITGNTFIGGAAGVNIQPQYLWGLLHALDGNICQVAVAKFAAWTGATTGADMPDFDPFAISYAGASSLLFEALLTEGVAHKVYDYGQSQYGTIYSSPFVSVWHEMGGVDIPTAFAEHGNELVATSGGKPALVTSTYTGFAGMPAPTTAPTFDTERFPIWKPNVRSTTAESASNDPIAGAAPEAATQINHYDNHGANYWRQVDITAQTGNAEMVFSKSTHGRMFAFKAYVKPRRVEGRSVIFAARNNDNSGQVFVEIRDGKLAVGFFDTYLKKDVWVETTQQVLTPGYWHYIYVRKKFPQNEAYDGNWVNSHFAHSQMRRAVLSAVPADTLAEFVTIADGGGHTGYVIGTPNLAAGFGAYAANGITKIDYIKTSAAELTTGAVTVNTVGGYALTSTFQPTHDSMVVRRFGTALTDYTDSSRMDPLLAKVGVLVQLTITGGTQAAAGDVLTSAGGGVGTVLWAHAVITGVQNICLYFTTGTTFAAGNISGGGITNSTMTAGPTTYRDCISLVCDDKVLVQGGATGWVSRPFAGGIFNGLAGGVVNFNLTANSAVPFHPGMVGMYWMWGSLGGATASKRGKLHRITSVSADGTQILTVVAGTSTAESFAGITNCEGGVFAGVGLKKSDGFDDARTPEQADVDIRAFGHSDSADESSGISPFDGEWAAPGWTMVEPDKTTNGPENYKPFETAADYSTVATNDAIQVGTDFFKYPIFALGAPDRLHFDDWGTAAQKGTWFCPNDVQTYAAGSNGTSSQPNYDGTTALAPVVTRSTTNPTCSVNAPDARIRSNQDAATYTGTRYIRYCFYDKDQDALSNPSPAVPVTIAAEDSQNATSQFRYKVGALGVPRRIGNYETWLFMGIAGGTSEDLFRVAQVPAGTSEVAVSLPEDTISSLLPMEISNGEPPRCNLVASDGDRVYYGALESDPSAGLYSTVLSPGSIDFTAPGGSAFFASGGEGTEITCLHSLDQQVLIGKRRMMGTLSVDATLGASVRIISRSIGCVSPQSVRGRDNRVYFVGERGLALISRYGNTNLGIPLYISSNVQELYQTSMDRSYDGLVVGAMNEKRGQYIHTYRPLGETRPTKRVVAMFRSSEGGADGNPLLVYNADAHAFTVDDVLTLSAVGTIPGAAGQSLLVGGTDDGFLVWMDRPDTQSHLMGESGGIWLTNPTTATTNVGTGYVQISALAISDTDLEGARGILMRFADSGGVERAVRLLGSSGKYLIFDEVAGAAPVASGTLTFGAQIHYFETGWMGLGNPQQLKNFLYLDVVAKKISSGSLRFDFYRTGMGDALDDTVIDTHDQDMASGRKQISIRGLDGRWAKLVVRSVPLTTKAYVSISDLVLRLYDDDQD